MDFVSFMTMHKIVAVPVALFAIVLCGCSSGSSEASGAGAPIVSGASEKVSAVDVGYEPKDPDRIGAGLQIGTVTTRNKEEAAVSAAWTTYWRARLQAWNQGDTSLPSIKNVSSGTAQQELLDGANTLKQNGNFMVGLLKVGVIDVEITNGEALLRGCVGDALQVVDAEGQAVNDTSSTTRMRMVQAVKKGSQWLIVKDDLAASSTSTCDPGI
jgi:hypothetical protein